MPSCKLLLADDEHYVTSVLSNKLGRLFDEVIVASDGEEAFHLAVAESPALVISDYQMPGTDGFTLATKLKLDSRTAGIPVVLLTARGHLLAPEQLAKTNIVRVMAKPFSLREIFAAVEEVMGGGASKAEAA